MDESDFPPELPPLRERLTDERWRTDAASSPGHPRNYLWQVLERAFMYYEISCREYAARNATYLEYREDLEREEQRLGQLHRSGSSGGGSSSESVELSEYVERLETARNLADDCFLRAERARDRVSGAYARWEFRGTELHVSPDGGKPKRVGRGHRLKHSSRL